MNPHYFVADTNIFVSAVLTPASAPNRALEKALNRGKLLFSSDTFAEFVSVLRRPKFDTYATKENREKYILRIENLSDTVEISSFIHACRDPKDDKFLDVALNGGAAFILTGDTDLLDLHPFQGIAILSPADYLAAVASS